MEREKEDRTRYVKCVKQLACEGVEREWKLDGFAQSNQVDPLFLLLGIPRQKMMRMGWLC